MRVWLWQEKEYGDVGARRWLVEWYTVRPKAKARVEAAEARGELDEYDPDRDIECNERSFGPKAKGAAVAFAKRVAVGELSAYGCARVIPQIVSTEEAPDGFGEWAEAGEVLEVS